jgi:hypothetical protein
MAQVALAVIAALGVVLAGAYVVLGAEAIGPGTYDVSGTVMEQRSSQNVPAAGATVVLTVNGGPPVLVLTGADGSFTFSKVAAGGISINVTQPQYAPVTVDTFASPIYSTGTTDLSILLVPGNASNGTTQTLTPFSDLESFLASLGSAAALLGIVAVLGGWAAIITGRSNRPAVGVVGGAGGLLAPVAIYFLSLGGVFPDLIVGSAVLAAVGAFAVTTRSLEILQVGPEPSTSS